MSAFATAIVVFTYSSSKVGAMVRTRHGASTVYRELGLQLHHQTSQRRVKGKPPVGLSITHISCVGFASVESPVILFVTPIREGVTDERRHGSRCCRLA